MIDSRIAFSRLTFIGTSGLHRAIPLEVSVRSLGRGGASAMLTVTTCPGINKRREMGR